MRAKFGRDPTFVSKKPSLKFLSRWSNLELATVFVYFINETNVAENILRWFSRKKAKRDNSASYRFTRDDRKSHFDQLIRQQRVDGHQ